MKKQDERPEDVGAEERPQKTSRRRLLKKLAYIPPAITVLALEREARAQATCPAQCPSQCSPRCTPVCNKK